VLDFTEEPFNEVPLSVEFAVDRPLFLAILLSWYVGFTAAFSDEIYDRFGVIAPIGHQGFGWRQAFNEGRDSRLV
jgi:hypothetical protein